MSNGQNNPMDREKEKLALKKLFHFMYAGAYRAIMEAASNSPPRPDIGLTDDEVELVLKFMEKSGLHFSATDNKWETAELKSSRTPNDMDGWEFKQ